MGLCLIDRGSRLSGLNLVTCSSHTCMRFQPANAERITAALKALPIKLCGYSGLMLPVMEDEGLARVADEQRITVGSLLHYSGLADKAGTYGALAAFC